MQKLKRLCFTPWKVRLAPIVAGDVSVMVWATVVVKVAAADVPDKVLETQGRKLCPWVLRSLSSVY